MGFIIETPLSPHMAGRPTRLIARDSLLLDMASRASRCKARRQSPSLVPSSKHDPICAMSVQCVLPISVAPRISWRNAALSSKHGSIFDPVGSVCSSHLVCSTHLVDKRGALEQARITLSLVGSVKVFRVFLLTLEQTQTHSIPCRLSQSPPLRTNANRSVPRRLYQGWPPRTSSIRLRPACSVKVDSVIV